MRIIVFGCGNGFTNYHNCYKEYWNDNDVEILAFLDNDQKKWGTKFMGKEICSPDAICQLNYDVVLIASVYEEEVFNQLNNILNVDKNKIYIRQEFFEKIIFSWYDKKYDLYNK